MQETQGNRGRSRTVLQEGDEVANDETVFSYILPDNLIYSYLCETLANITSQVHILGQIYKHGTVLVSRREAMKCQILFKLTALMLLMMISGSGAAAHMLLITFKT
jgi:hypothetical protein